MAAPPSKSPRTCSQCGNNGHNARTCTELSTATATATATATETVESPGIFIFGVRLNATSETNNSPSPTSPCISPSSSCSSFVRKSMSMNNLSQYEQQHEYQKSFLPLDSSNVNDVASGYASDDALHASGCRTRERKRGIPWTEEEHRLFLMGLDKVGKGDWRGISRNFVKTRTPTQVASHAQKYFLRRSNVNRRRRRSSLFDITTDTMIRSASEGQLASQDNSTITSQLKSHQSIPIPSPYHPPIRPISAKHVRLIPVPPSSKMACLNLNQSPTIYSTSTYNNTTTTNDQYEPLLSLKLSQAPSDEESSRRSRSPPTFGGFSGNGDSIISVA